ncbi:MAG: serine hydrolase [Anaerolineae bacterium]|nr:serine hydrolase [Anaerolineae bacterium]
MSDHPNIPARDYWPTTGWRSADPADLSLDGAQLERAADLLTAQYPHIDSLIVVRGGYLVFERYPGVRGPDVLRNLKSVTKSVLSTLIGIALDTGDLGSLDDRLGDYVPAYFTSADDPRKRAITVRDLLTMRSGLEWAEWGAQVIEMTSSPHWFRYVLDRPLIHDPGQHFNYSTGDSHLLAALLQAAAAMTALDFADLYLFKPLGITRRAWPGDPQGVTIGGAELSLTPRDLAKFGCLILNNGAWDGDTIVPADWVRDATRKQVSVLPADPDHPPLSYGYLWWVRPQGEYKSALAVGLGGQYVYVIPGLDMVIVMTGDIATAPDAFRDNRMIRAFNVVQDAIVPAVTPGG